MGFHSERGRQEGSSESSQVYQEVERRKQRAKSLKIPELFEELYFHGIKFYPSWIQHNRAYVPSSVSSAVEQDKERVVLELNGRKYTFLFKENRFSTPDGEMHRHGLLGLFYNDQRVLALNAAFEYEREYDPDWSIFDVEAFVEGDWLGDFVQLQRQVQTAKEERVRRERENPDKLAKLKKDFGIV